MLGDLDSTSEVEGTTFVGGNLTGSASNYATMFNPAQFLGTPTLSVACSISVGAININACDLHLGGSASGTINFNGGGQLVAVPATQEKELDRRERLGVRATRSG